MLDLTLSEPPGEATHWTGRMMAKVSGVSLRSVQRIWAAHGLAPHRIRTFKLSRDPLLSSSFGLAPSSPAIDSGSAAVDKSLEYRGLCDGQVLSYCGRAPDLGAAERSGA